MHLFSRMVIPQKGHLVFAGTKGTHFWNLEVGQRRECIASSSSSGFLVDIICGNMRLCSACIDARL